MNTLPEDAFLQWATKQGLALDPRYPEARVLTFSGQQKHSRFWAVPTEGRTIPYFVSTILRLLGTWTSCFIWKPLLSWRDSPDETMIDERVWHSILEGLGVPTGSTSVLEYGCEELADLVSVVFTQLVFGWSAPDDLYIVPDHAGSIVKTDHHDVVHVSFRREDAMRELVRGMQEEEFPLPTEVPDGTFKKPDWMPSQ